MIAWQEARHSAGRLALWGLGIALIGLLIKRGDRRFRFLIRRVFIYRSVGRHLRGSAHRAHRVYPIPRTLGRPPKARAGAARAPRPGTTASTRPVAAHLRLGPSGEPDETLPRLQSPGTHIGHSVPALRVQLLQPWSASETRESTAAHRSCEASRPRHRGFHSHARNATGRRTTD